MPVKYLIPIKFIKLDEKSLHLLIEGELNHNTVNLIVDTGASRTVFDKSFQGINLRKAEVIDSEEIHSAGIMPGTIESECAIADSFKLGKLELKDFPVVIIDMREINKLYLKYTGKQIHGLLGCDFLFEMNAVIDYGKASLVLRGPDDQDS